MSNAVSPALLEVRDLHTWFDVEGERARAVRGVDLTVRSGEVLGLVGESGSGKSVIALSVMRLIPDPPGRIERGSALFQGRDLLALPLPELRAVRGREVAMVFQEPMTSLDPVFTVGMQVMEPLRHHLGLGRREARERAIEALAEVGLPAPARRLDDYPHQLSGGMRQRVMIAIALACSPALLLADEPTTALDVTIQAQILERMLALQQRRPEASIVLITHDLAVVAETCHRVVVLYGGRVQEEAGVCELFDAPQHPYTRGLLASIVRLHHRGGPLPAIPGSVPGLLDFPPGCRFCSRCAQVMDVCRGREPELVEVAPGHRVRCHLVGSR